MRRLFLPNILKIEKSLEDFKKCCDRTLIIKKSWKVALVGMDKGGPFRKPLQDDSDHECQGPTLSITSPDGTLRRCMKLYKVRAWDKDTWTDPDVQVASGTAGLAKIGKWALKAQRCEGRIK